MLNIIDLEILEMHCNCSMFVVWSKYWSGF